MITSPASHFQMVCQDMKLFCAILLLCAAPAHTWEWSDCSDPKTRAIEIINFDVSPKPLHIPGNATVAIVGKVTHEVVFNSYYRLNVTLEKKLLGHWHSVPCSKRLFPIGSCIYEDQYACEFLRMLPLPYHPTCPVTCPVDFASSHLNSCQINHEFMHARVTVVNLKDVKASIYVLFTGDFRARFELIEHTTMIGCLTMEFSIKTPCTGFLCGK